MIIRKLLTFYFENITAQNKVAKLYIQKIEVFSNGEANRAFTKRTYHFIRV